MQIIPLTVFFPPDKRDRELQQKLRAALPGILNWAMVGYAAWREIGLAPPDSVLAATAAYRADEDRTGQFIADCCLQKQQLSVKASALYRAYNSWSESRGESPLSMTRFGTRLTERGIGRVKNSVMYYVGIALRADDSSDNSPELSLN